MAKGTLEDMIRKGWNAYSGNFLQFLLALFLTPIIGILIFGIGLLPLALLMLGLTAGGMTIAEAGRSLVSNWASLGFSLLFMIVFMLVALAACMALRGGLVAMMVEALRKGRTSYRTMFSSARERWADYVAVTLITAAVVCAVMAVLMGPGLWLMVSGSEVTGALVLMLSMLVLLPVAFVLEVLFSFIYMAVAADKLTAVKAVKTSVSFGRRNFWITLGLIVFFALVSLLASFLNFVTLVLGTLLAVLVIAPVQLLSLTALYLGKKTPVKKKGRR